MPIFKWVQRSRGQRIGLFALAISGLLCAAAAAEEVLVVCPTAFRQAAEDYLDYRRGDGLSVRVLSSEKSSADLKRKIAGIGRAGGVRYIVLLGDCRLGASAGQTDPRFEVPTLHQPAEVTIAWGTTPQLPGDAFYGDFDEDGIPEAVVGRIPVDTAEQLTAYTKRVQSYEASRDFGAWRQQISLTAGVGGFGFLADAAIESVTRQMITQALPGWMQTHITYASPSSPFNPGLDRFHEAVLGRYREGALFWVYAGHGNVCDLDRVPASAEGRPVLSVTDVDRLELPRTPPPIALMLACYTGAFDARRDCLAESMLLADQGPIACVAGSRVTMPYGNATVATGLIHAVFTKRATRLGDAWLATLRELATESAVDPALQQRRAMLDTIAQMISPAAHALPAERREHMQLYNLLGDPLIRLSPPQPLEIQVDRQVAAGSTMTVAIDSPFAGELSLQLHRPAGTPTEPVSEDRFQSINRTAVANVTRPVERGSMEVDLEAPAKAGLYLVVGRIKNADRFAVGVQKIIVYDP